jgi:hypothetical protein
MDGNFQFVRYKMDRDLEVRFGAAAGIRTRVSSLLVSNFEAWEAPVIDQVILPDL